MNPHNSPWNKPAKQHIADQQLYRRWSAIQKHLVNPVSVIEHNVLEINHNIYIAKHSSKFRLRSHLDWAWYTPKTIAQAIDANTTDQYYEYMLRDARSDPNEWKHKDLEMELKAFYAARVGRCSLV